MPHSSEPFWVDTSNMTPEEKRDVEARRAAFDEFYKTGSTEALEKAGVLAPEEEDDAPDDKPAAQ